jgi:predicted RNase H-like HicB family nuclease
MSTAETVRRGMPFTELPNCEWQVFEHERALQCRALLCPEETGFSAHCLNLPGVVSQGESEKEAIENIADAFRETILYYRSTDEAVPWAEVPVEYPAGSRERWILVRI